MGASDSETLANMVNLYLGVGILSLPWSFAGASMLGGVIVIGIGVAWSAATNVIMIRLAERTHQFTLNHILAALPGGWFWEPVGTIVLFFMNFLCLVGYLVVFADNFEKVVIEAMLGYEGSGNTRFLLIALGCVLVFPLCLLDQSRLAFTSTISVVANWFICIVMIKQAFVADELSTVCVAGWGVGELTMISVVMMAAAFQQCILPVYEEMENRQLSSFISVQIRAMAIAFVLLSVVSVAGYLLYGSAIASNVLMELPPTFANVAAQASIIPVVVGIYPLLQYPISVAFRDILFPVKGRSGQEQLLTENGQGSPSALKNGDGAILMFLRIGVIVASGLVAGTGVDLGPINNVSGILSLGWFTVAMPGLAYYHLLQLDGESSVLLWIHLSVGAILTVLACFYTGNQVESLDKHCILWWV